MLPQHIDLYIIHRPRYDSADIYKDPRIYNSASAMDNLYINNCGDALHRAIRP